MTDQQYIEIELSYTLEPQSEIETILQQQTRLRDFYYDDKDFGDAILVVICNLVAQKVNGTLIGMGHPMYGNSTNSKIIPYAFLLDKSEIGVFPLIDRYFQQGPVRLRSIATDPLNFMYCSIPSKHIESIWKFSIFSVSFDVYTWILLFISLFFVGVLSFSNISERRLVVRIYHFDSMLVLLNLGGPVIPSTFSHSWLFTLWLFICPILNNLYTGDVTSHVIVPEEEPQMKRLKELEMNNFSLTFDDNYTIELLTSMSSSLHGISEYAPILGNLLNGSYVFPFVEWNPDSIWKYMIDNDKLGTIEAWYYVAGLVLRSKHGLQNALFTTSTNKKCYLGKDLFYDGEIYYAFLPPNNDKPSSQFQRVMESGLFTRWTFERTSFYFSNRVQDRVRIKNKIIILTVGEPAEPIRLEGKVLIIYLLWSFCILVAIGVFFGEILYFSNENQTSNVIML